MRIKNTSIVGKGQYRYLIYIFCFFIALQFVCDILVLRLFKVGSLEFTASSIIFCLNFVLMDVVANVYGMKEARRLAFVNFFLQLFCGFALYLFLIGFEPHVYQNANYQLISAQLKAFGLLISNNLLVIPFSVLLGNLCNAFFMSLSKYLLYGRFVGLRSLVCTAASAFVMLLTSYSKIYWDSGAPFIFHVVISSMVVKIIGATLLMLPAQYISYALKKSEGVDVYDLHFKFLAARQRRILELMQKRG